VSSGLEATAVRLKRPASVAYKDLRESRVDRIAPTRGVLLTRMGTNGFETSLRRQQCGWVSQTSTSRLLHSASCARSQVTLKAET
jgi:hypothetical protein